MVSGLPAGWQLAQVASNRPNDQKRQRAPKHWHPVAGDIPVITYKLSGDLGSCLPLEFGEAGKYGEFQKSDIHNQIVGLAGVSIEADRQSKWVCWT